MLLIPILTVSFVIYFLFHSTLLFFISCHTLAHTGCTWSRKIKGRFLGVWNVVLKKRPFISLDFLFAYVLVYTETFIFPESRLRLRSTPSTATNNMLYDSDIFSHKTSYSLFSVKYTRSYDRKWNEFHKNFANYKHSILIDSK